MTTVDRIFQLIEENQLTAKEFAKMCDLSAGNLTDWKTGRAKPSIESLKKISRYLNINIEWLLGENVKKEKDDYSKYLSFPDDFKYYSYDLPNVILYKIFFITNILFSTDSNVEDTSKHIDIYISSFNIPMRYRRNVRQAVLYLYNYNIKHPKKNYLDYSYNNYNETKRNTNNNNNLFYIPVVGKIAAGQPILAEEYKQGVLPIDPNIYGLSTSEDLFYLLVSGDSMDRKVENGDYVLIHKQDYAEDGDIIVAIVNDDDEATLKRYKVISNQYVQLEPMSTNPIHQTRTIDLKTTKFLIIGKAIGKFGKF